MGEYRAVLLTALPFFKKILPERMDVVRGGREPLRRKRSPSPFKGGFWGAATKKAPLKGEREA